MLLKRTLAQRAVGVCAGMVIAAFGIGAATASAAPLAEFNLPAGASATSLIDGPDGALYFAETTTTGQKIGRITTSGTITTTPVNTAGDISSMALAANGTIWFSISDGALGVGKLTPSGQVTIINPGMDGLSANAIPNEMTDSPDGSVWFLDHYSGSPGVGEISPSGTISEYPDSNGSAPEDLAVGAGNKLWFTTREVAMAQPAGVGVANPGAPANTPATVFATNSVPFPATMPSGITDGPDGNVWFTDQGSPSGVGRVTPAGTVSEFGMSNGLQMNAAPDAAISGPGGNVWFDDQYGTNPAVGKVNPAGQITEYPIAGEPWDLTIGIDGNLWLPTGNSDGTDTGVARVTPAGKIDIFSAGLNPSAVVEDLTNIASGPDGNLWFIDRGTPFAIVRADVQLPPTVTTGAATNVTASSAQISGSANGRGAASTVTIQYGTTPAFGLTAAAGSEAADNVTGAVSATVTKLPAGTVIYYRLVATNTYGAVFGNTLNFTTAGKPPPVGPAAGTRTLHATVGDQQITVVVPATTPCLAAGAGLSLQLSSATISGSKAAQLSFKRAAVFIDRGVRHTRIKHVTVHHRKHRKRITVYVPNATASHLPTTLSPSLHGLRSGKHTLRLKLSYTRTHHVKHRTVHTGVTKTIKTTFTVC
jgi:streptogramin lyase